MLYGHPSPIGNPYHGLIWLSNDKGKSIDDISYISLVYHIYDIGPIYAYPMAHIFSLAISLDGCKGKSIDLSTIFHG